MEEFTRRDALAGAATLGAITVAGCVADDSNNETAGGQNGNESDDSKLNNGSTNESDDGGGETTLSVVESGIETTGTGCAGDGDSAALTVESETVTVDGTLTAGNPCHEATLETAEVTDGNLSVVVDVAAVDETCVDCVGEINYEATLEVSGATAVEDFDGVTVEHVDGTTFALEDGSLVARDAPSGDPDGDAADTGIVDQSIETVEATCGGRNTHESTVEGNSVTVDGTFSVSNPCHEATLGGVSLDNGTLSVDVGARSTLGDDEICPQCIGEVTYRVEVTLADGTTVDNVSVNQLSAGSAPVERSE